MQSLWFNGRDSSSYFVALPYGQLFAGSFGERKKKNPEVNSHQHFLDNREGEESDSFQGGVFSCIEIEALFFA